MLNNLIIKHNIGNEIKDIKNTLIEECLSQRDKLAESNNFPIHSKHTNYLYNIFYQICKLTLNKFNLTDLNFRLWCYLTDKDFNDSVWHNHKKTTTINGVIYLKTQDKGIFFKHNNQRMHILPRECDILVFPSFLEHLPEVSKTEPRISLNLEET